MGTELENILTLNNLDNAIMYTIKNIKKLDSLGIENFNKDLESLKDLLEEVQNFIIERG